MPVEIVAPSYGIKTLLEGVLGDGLHGVWLDGKVRKTGRLALPSPYDFTSFYNYRILPFEA